MDIYALIGVVAVMMILAGHVLYIRIKILTTRSVEDLCRLYFRARIKMINFDPLREITLKRFQELVYIEYCEVNLSGDLEKYLGSFEKLASSKLLRDDRELIAKFLDKYFVKTILTKITSELESSKWNPSSTLISRVNAFFVETHYELHSQRIKEKFKIRFS